VFEVYSYIDEINNVYVFAITDLNKPYRTS
jgi:hypothetical protein